MLRAERAVRPVGRAGVHCTATHAGGGACGAYAGPGTPPACTNSTVLLRAPPAAEAVWLLRAVRAVRPAAGGQGRGYCKATLWCKAKGKAHGHPRAAQCCCKALGHPQCARGCPCAFRFALQQSFALQQCAVLLQECALCLTCASSALSGEQGFTASWLLSRLRARRFQISQLAHLSQLWPFGVPRPAQAPLPASLRVMQGEERVQHVRGMRALGLGT